MNRSSSLRSIWYSNIHLHQYANPGLAEPIDLTFSSRGWHEIRIPLPKLSHETVWCQLVTCQSIATAEPPDKGTFE